MCKHLSSLNCRGEFSKWNVLRKNCYLLHSISTNCNHFIVNDYPNELLLHIHTYIYSYLAMEQCLAEELLRTLYSHFNLLMTNIICIRALESFIHMNSIQIQPVYHNIPKRFLIELFLIKNFSLSNQKTLNFI